jgi:short-subunit dehydrogenase
MTEQKVAVVTGASSGIGAATASHLAAAGFRVFGASRSAPAQAGGAEGTRAVAVEHVTMDVRDDASVRRGVEHIYHTAGWIDVLVNNAGYLCAGGVEETALAEAIAQFQTNYFGVLRITQAVLPRMRDRSVGHIITVGALAGLVPVPFWSQYSASKFAVEGLMETLRHEVRPFGIQVAMVEPGAVRTPFFAGREPAGVAAYAVSRGRAFAAIAEFERRAPGPDIVAAKIAAIATDPHPALRNKVTRQARQVTRLRWLLPARVFEVVVRRELGLAPG